ncbi:hypothetical protein HYH02_013538 [Chlamydomonas schloesseri]|uniref:Uncharacterized protein n=1 Tax=Chlamydomonas schloesseri TaxID=2026947 RepID=A0A835VZ57_9CHLO|nr:hypothetical protein HYH02_013538 [Chlamydomonas schloesseri]|eukprot:KAG2431009.1 hypothetical protein HYH02_013538 [Chlamydomonas schloesseri]
MVAMLLENHANPNAAIASKATGPTSAPARPAAAAPRQGAPPSPPAPPRIIPADLQKTCAGDTALHIAIDAAGSAAVVKALVACPTTDVNAPNARGRSPAYKAVKRSSVACWDALRAAQPPGRLDLDRSRVIFAAVQSPMEFAAYRWAPGWTGRADAIAALSRRGARASRAMLEHARHKQWPRVVSALEAALQRQGPGREPERGAQWAALVGPAGVPEEDSDDGGTGRVDSHGGGSGGRVSGGTQRANGGAGAVWSFLGDLLFPAPLSNTEQMIQSLTSGNPFVVFLLFPIVMPVMLVGIIMDMVVMALRIWLLVTVVTAVPVSLIAWRLGSWALAWWRSLSRAAEAAAEAAAAAAAAAGAGGSGGAGTAGAGAAAGPEPLVGAVAAGVCAGGGAGRVLGVFSSLWEALMRGVGRMQLALLDAAAALRYGPQAVSEPDSPAAAAQAGVAAVFVVAWQAAVSAGVVAAALVLAMVCAALCCETSEMAVGLVLGEGAWLRRAVERRGMARRQANGSPAESRQLMAYFWVSLLVRWATGVGFWPLACAMLASALVAELLRVA